MPRPQCIVQCKGLSPDSKYAVIESWAYSEAWIRNAQARGVSYRDSTVVQTITKDGDVVQPALDTGENIYGQHCVVATGGNMALPAWNGLLKPCYSYLVRSHSIDRRRPQWHHRPTFLLETFTHDWYFTASSVGSGAHAGSR